jgi:hypothetical protein
VLVTSLIVVAIISAGAAYFFLRDKPRGSPAKPPVVATASTPAAESSPTPSLSPTLDPVMVTYLQSLEGLIRQAGQGRHAVLTATAGYRARTMSAAAAAAMIQSVIDNRNSVLAALASLSVPADPQASSCQAAFTKAMHYSILADERYQAWALGSGSIKAAAPYNAQAGQWKATFVSEYDFLAQSYGLRYDWVVGDI